MAIPTSMEDRDGHIWFDNKMTPWRDAKTHVLTHTLHYGLGVFEGVRAYKTNEGTAIFRLKEHTDRFFNSAHILGMKMPYDKNVIMDAHKKAVKENKLESAYIRPMAFYGAEAMGISAKTLSTHVIVAAWEWGAYMGKEALENGIRVKTSSFSRHHVNITMCKAKASGNYMNSMLALQEALEHKGYQVLDMTVEDAREFFDAIPAVARKLQTLMDVGLSYIKLGQSATTLSGGEAQRIKLSKELSKRDTGKTLYILDEPTTGLHFHDIEHLLAVLHKLRDDGNTIVVIEHNLDVIKTADWVVDLGPEGGSGGGMIIAEGTPEQVAKNKKSHTGVYIKQHLAAGA